MFFFKLLKYKIGGYSLSFMYNVKLIFVIVYTLFTCLFDVLYLKKTNVKKCYQN